jgi:hypothetical protein
MTTQVMIPIEVNVKFVPTNEIAKATEYDLIKPDNSKLFFELIASESGVA